MKKMVYVLVLCVLAFSLVACDSGSGPSGADTGVDDQQETQQNPPQEYTGSEDQEGSDDGVGYDDFESSLQDNPEYHVEYDLTYSSGREENVVIYTKDDKTRMEVENDGETVTAWMNGKSVVEYEGQCVDLGTASQLGFDPESIHDMTTVEGSVKTDEKYIDVSSAGTKTIAGKTTTCYEIAYETDSVNEMTTYCLTDEGIPALLEVVDSDTGDVKSEARALTIEDSVSDDVLEPCEPDMDISGLI